VTPLAAEGLSRLKRSGQHLQQRPRLGPGPAWAAELSPPDGPRSPPRRAGRRPHAALPRHPVEGSGPLLLPGVVIEPSTDELPRAHQAPRVSPGREDVPPRRRRTRRRFRRGEGVVGVVRRCGRRRLGARPRNDSCRRGAVEGHRAARAGDEHRDGEVAPPPPRGSTRSAVAGRSPSRRGRPSLNTSAPAGER